MTRGVGDLQAHPFDIDAIAISDADRDDFRLALLAHDGDALRALAQRIETGDVIGVQMGVDGLHQAHIQLLEELKVAIDPLQDGIDDERLAAMATGEEIGVGAGHAVEQLPEDHPGDSLSLAVAWGRFHHGGGAADFSPNEALRLRRQSGLRLCRELCRAPAAGRAPTP